MVKISEEMKDLFARKNKPEVPKLNLKMITPEMVNIFLLYSGSTEAYEIWWGKFDILPTWIINIDENRVEYFLKLTLVVCAQFSTDNDVEVEIPVQAKLWSVVVDTSKIKVTVIVPFPKEE